MEVQYITDAKGTRTAAIISIDDWHGLTGKYPEITNSGDDLPQWQKALMDDWLARIQAHTNDIVTGEAFKGELEPGIDEEFKTLG